MLKMELKVRRGTLAPGENDFEVGQGLEQRIGVRALRRRALAGQPRSQRVQIAPQSLPQPIDRFHSERQTQLFGGGFERKPRQHFHQPLPNQRSRQGVTWQNVSQDEGKSPPATAAATAIGAKHPPPPDGLATGLSGVVAPENAVPIQCFNSSAAGAALLLEGKSCVFNSWASWTK
jgi:hypothetical protein